MKQAPTPGTRPDLRNAESPTAKNRQTQSPKPAHDDQILKIPGLNETLFDSHAALSYSPSGKLGVSWATMGNVPAVRQKHSGAGEKCLLRSDTFQTQRMRNASTDTHDQQIRPRSEHRPNGRWKQAKKGKSKNAKIYPIPSSNRNPVAG